LKSRDDVQRAHDVLVAVILDEVPVDYDESTKRDLEIAASVLCWILEHTDNSLFGKILSNVEQEIENTGMTLTKKLIQ